MLREEGTELRESAMIVVRRAHQRGHAQHGWLESFHTFSFAGYHDPEHMGFRDLRVINEDFVAPGRGFGSHSHRDMEIVSVVLDGVLEHRDSMGNTSEIRPGEVQRMTAGTGVTHSEYNGSQTEQVHFLQIWILPERPHLEPSYEQRSFPDGDRRNTLQLLASRSGEQDSIKLHQDVELYGSLLEPGKSVSHRLAPSRHAWLQLTGGAVTLQGESLEAGDGVAVSGESLITVRADEPAELLLFDLA
jgi:redox-sensitive bicupin YhaK (pirin superfamily)